MPTIEAIPFRLRNGQTHVDRWPEFVAFSQRLMREGDGFDLQSDVLTITVANGSQRYRLIDPLPEDEDPQELVGIRAVRMDS